MQKKSSLGKAYNKVFQLSTRACLKHWRLLAVISGDNKPSPMVLILSHSCRLTWKAVSLLSSFTCSWKVVHPNLQHIWLKYWQDCPSDIWHFIEYGILYLLCYLPNSVIPFISKMLSYHMLSRYQTSNFNYSDFGILNPLSVINDGKYTKWALDDEQTWGKSMQFL